MSDIRMRKTTIADCDECGKNRKGVLFEMLPPFSDSTGESFLCWEHFRSMLATMTQAGILVPPPSKQVIISRCECCHCCRQWTVETRRKLRGESWTESRGE